MKVTPKQTSKYLTVGNDYTVVRTDRGGNQFVIADDGECRPYSSSTFHQCNYRESVNVKNLEA